MSLLFVEHCCSFCMSFWEKGKGEKKKKNKQSFTLQVPFLLVLRTVFIRWQTRPVQREWDTWWDLTAVWIAQRRHRGAVRLGAHSLPGKASSAGADWRLMSSEVVGIGDLECNVKSFATVRLSAINLGVADNAGRKWENKFVFQRQSQQYIGNRCHWEEVSKETNISDDSEIVCRKFPRCAATCCASSFYWQLLWQVTRDLKAKMAPMGNS